MKKQKGWWSLYTDMERTPKHVKWKTQCATHTHMYMYTYMYLPREPSFSPKIPHICVSFTCTRINIYTHKHICMYTYKMLPFVKTEGLKYLFLFMYIFIKYTECVPS